MRVAVLGGNGFIGSHVTDVLVSRGHLVTVFDRVIGRNFDAPEGTRTLLGSFEDNRAVGEAIAGADVVVHLIATTVPETSMVDPVRDIETNLAPTLRLLEACVRQRVGRVVFFSSGGGVYGTPTTDFIPEGHSTDPLSSYGIIKLTVEKYLQMFHHQHGLEYTIIRPSNPYGERQDVRARVGLIMAALNACVTGDRLKIWGDGSVVRDYFYVGDLAVACADAIQAGVTGIFNVGAGSGVAVNELLEQVRVITGRPLHVTYSAPRAIDPGRNVLDITRAREAFGWQPVTTLSDGIARTWRWVQSQVPRPVA